MEQYNKLERQISNRLKEIDGLVQKTFEKNCAGLLPDSVMADLMKGYDIEKYELNEKLSESQDKRLIVQSQAIDISKEIDNLRLHAEISTLNRTIVTNLIKSIHISEPTIMPNSESKKGEKQYAIEIRYRFQNSLNV